MSTASAPIPPAAPPAPQAPTTHPTHPTSLRRGYRFELDKLLAQWRVRVLVVLCWVAPALVVALVGHAGSLPTDTVFGRWMGQSAWAGSLVVLAFCGSWGLPLVTSLVAGDVFASEDRLGTWRHLLVTVRSPGRIFAAKALASLTVVVVLVVGLAVSGTLGGLASVGGRTLVGLDGRTLSPGDAAASVALAWLCVLAPTLAFAAVGLLGSVLLGRSPTGLLTPALLAVVLDVAQLLPLPAVVRLALPSYGFIAWRGLFTDPVLTAPLVVGTLVSLAWAVVATALAHRHFVRRDFTDPAHDGSGRRALAGAALPLAGVLALSVGAVALVTPTSGSGIDGPTLEASLATSFDHLYVRQTDELHRPVVTEAQVAATAACDKGGSLVDDVGAGNDWRCVVTWHLPGATATGSAIYQLDVTPDGRYVADGDGPASVNGFFTVRTATGDAPNPLWQLDGLVDLVHRTPKG